jgi:two-component system cell cycle response regulator DivK
MIARVLVAEDDELSRVLADDILRANGYDVVTASTGQEAITQAIRHKPALILMDIQMPLLTGREAAKMLKAHPDTSAIPIVALTASAMAGDVARYAQEGFAATLTKPTTPSLILSMVRRFLPSEKEPPCLQA